MIGDPTGILAKIWTYISKMRDLQNGEPSSLIRKARSFLYEVSAGNIGRNADELLRKVQAAQFVHLHGDEVCPAKWKPGSKTLKPGFDLVGKI